MPDDIFTLNVDGSELDFGQNSPSTLKLHREMADAVNDIAQQIEETAEHLAGRQTGELAARGIVREEARTGVGNEVTAVVGLRYRPIQGIIRHEGSGIFGPSHRRIFPTHRRVLAFPYHGRIVFARSVAGQRGRRFMPEALNIVERTYVRTRAEELRARLII